jgi:WD40 repeat protein
MDGTVRLWTIATGQHAVLMESPQRRFGPVIWSSDGQSLIWLSHGIDGNLESEISVWDASTQRVTTRHALTEVATCLAAVPKQRQIVYGSTSGALHLLPYDEPGKATEITPAREGMEVLSVSVSSDGQRLAAGLGRNNDWSAPGEFQVWNLPDRKQLVKHNTWTAIRRTVFVPGQYQVASTDGGQMVARVAIETPNVAVAISVPHEGRVRDLQFVTGDLMASVGEDDALTILPMVPKSPEKADLPPREEIMRFRGHKGPLWSLSSTPDGNTLATGGSDGTVRIWNRNP